MDRSLYVAMTGATQIMRAQDVVSHNLANASTTAFKSELDAFQSLPVLGPGQPSRINAVAYGLGRDESQGPMQHTGRGNYRRVGELIGAPLEEQPTLLLEVEVGALAAAAYWHDNGLNSLADTGDVLTVSRKINLGSATSKHTPEGLQDRIDRTNRALALLGAR